MSSVTFKCLRSGNTVSFDDPEAIAELRGHEGYTEVIDTIKEKSNEALLPQDAEAQADQDAEAEVVIPAALQEAAVVTKKRGRKPRVAEEVI